MPSRCCASLTRANPIIFSDRSIKPMIYGYARVSTQGKSEAAQVGQLRPAVAKKVFREVASGAKTDRPQLRRLLAGIGPGDVVMVRRLDRLGRPARDPLQTPP